MQAWWLDRMTQTSNSSTSHVESESSLQSPHLNSWYGHMVNAHWCPHSKTSLLHWVQFFYNACMKFSIFLLVMLLQPDCSEDFSHLLGLTVPFLVVSVAHLASFYQLRPVLSFLFHPSTFGFIGRMVVTKAWESLPMCSSYVWLHCRRKGTYKLPRPQSHTTSYPANSEIIILGSWHYYA